MFIFYKNFENKMYKVRKTPKKEITNLVNLYAERLTPTHKFLEDYFIKLTGICMGHYRGKKLNYPYRHYLDEMKAGLIKAEKATDSHEANRELVKGAIELCRTCERNSSKIPALFNLVNKILS